MTEHDHQAGLELLGMWPGPLDVVREARTRREAAAALAELQATAKSAARVVARRLHPDLVGHRRGEADLRAVQAAHRWVAAQKLSDLWPRRRPTRQLRARAGSPVVVEVSATGIRIAWRGSGRP